MKITAPATMRSTAQLAATQLAMVHGRDFERLGATDVDVSAAGVTLRFATQQRTGDMAALLREGTSVIADGSRVEVPIIVAGQPAPPASIEGVVEALRELDGVTSVDADRGTALLKVGTPDTADAERLNRILRREVLGYDLVYDSGVASDNARGWGSGIG